MLPTRSDPSHRLFEVGLEHHPVAGRIIAFPVYYYL